MPTRKFRQPVALLALAIVFGINGRTYCQSMPKEREKEETAWKNLTYQRADDCNRCHVKPRNNGDFPDPAGNEAKALDIVLLTEYSIWKTHDKHAQAYAVLKGPRGKHMGELLGQNVLKSEPGCLSCHAMGNLVGKAGGLRLEDWVEDGVSCAGCHGPSTGTGGWSDPHWKPAWRNVAPEEKFKMGLRDLRDPATRATLCLSCHVGNVAEGKVVTHAMFAAGHPPLPPIEIASFSRNEPQHWRDARNVPFFQNLDKLPNTKLKEMFPPQDRVKNYHLEDLDYNRTRFALIGAVVSMRETLRLAQQRSDFKAPAPQTVWPELLMGLKDTPSDDTLRKDARARWPEVALAHSDCYSCHHDLRFPGYRQTRGFGYQLPGLPAIQVAPGRVLIRTWPTAPFLSTFAFLGKPDLGTELHTHLKGLAAAVNSRQYGNPDEVLARTTEAIKWCDTIIADLKMAKFNTASVQRLIVSLCDLYEKKDSLGRPMLPDYEMARLVASILDVAYEEWTASGGKHKNADKARAAKEVFAALTTKLDLQPYTQREKRLDVIFDIIAKGRPLNDAAKAQFKSYLATKDSIANLDNLKKFIDEDAPVRKVLDAISNISNRDFNAGLLSPTNIRALQKQGDEEEIAVLKSISNYDPGEFKMLLTKLVETLK